MSTEDFSGQIRNEFAMVDVEIRPTHGGSVLFVRDAQTGAAIALDALELEALTRLRHVDFGALVDPSFESSVLRAGVPPEPSDDV